MAVVSELLFDGMTLTVEIGFSTTAGSGTVPTGATLLSDIYWTDVTADVRSITTSRGRSSELDDYTAGSCSVVLDNRARNYDPDYTGGPYYTLLTPLRPIRISVDTGTPATHYLYFGYIDQWPQDFELNSDATVTITASDGFKVLNQLTLPSLWNETITAAFPYRWFRMADFNGSFYVFDVANWNGTSAQWMSSSGGGAPSFCNPGPPLLVGESTTSSSFDGQRFVQASDPLGINGVTPMLSSWAVEMWIQTTETTTGNYAIWNHGDFIHGGSLGMVVAGGNATLVAQFGNRGTSNTMVTKNVQVTVNDGLPHHVALRYRSDPSLGTIQELYVDGSNTAAVSGSFTDIVNQGYYYMTLGSPSLKSLTSSNNFTEYFRGAIQDVVVYGDVTTLDEIDVYDHYTIGTGTYHQGFATSARIEELLDFIDWPNDGTNLDYGESTVLGLTMTGKTALAALKEVEQAEQGRLFMSPEGQIRFVDRNGLGSGGFVTIQQEFDDLAKSNPSHEISYSGIEFSYDDRFIFNDVSVQQPNGTSAQFQDATSQSQYYRRTLRIDNLIVETGYLLTNTATSLLAKYKQPDVRIDSLNVNLRAEPSKQDNILSLEIGDRVSVTRTPAVGSAIVKALIIEGIKHSITPESWNVQFNTSSTNDSPFVLDSSLLGVLDTNILGY